MVLAEIVFRQLYGSVTIDGKSLTLLGDTVRDATLTDSYNLSASISVMFPKP